jgi:hypothetical protein
MKSTRTSRQIPPHSVLLALVIAAGAAGCAASLAGSDKETKPADLEALKSVGGKANGLVVWTSSRAGTPHLFTMKTDGSEERQLTKGDFTDWNPRFSPDGRKILFSRSQDEGFVRESEGSAPGTWDLYTINVDGTEISKVVEDATWGSWFGADEIVFMRGTRIMRTKLGGEDEAKIMDLSRYPIFEGAIVQRPELSHDGHFVALTLAGNRRQTGIWNIKKKTWMQMGQGTQIAWAPDGASVYWIDASGKEMNRVVHEPVVAGTPADDRDPDKLLLVDLGGKRSRERFPRLSNDGKWLVFGAAIKDLENDLEDYELYLFELGSSPTSATRLTFHSANDRWPDLFVGEPGKAAASEAAEDKGGGESGEAKQPEKDAHVDAAKAAPAPAETETDQTEKKEEPAAESEASDEAAPPTAGAAKPKAKVKSKGKKKRR